LLSSSFVFQSADVRAENYKMPAHRQALTLYASRRQHFNYKTTYDLKEFDNLLIDTFNWFIFINNELLFIKLATVRAEGILIPHLLQAVKR
jgi:hypothetical protein